ncbi:23S rRNA methyltransferase [Ligilactobacillus salitolerans]|uniref:23S rRNA methyltransferase n=1 Tax=Ligilactobacillus salitolerans TaxID=1808352 RepID=A0A401IU80_9LACO|nr:RsmB/NOP family class I SAM-dependent RNA methyltransferase [Ligilactobacillus salitolerans]GBG95091.1 23S rRNA methyltransferase [Ligilactobacillus salitolerans]
MNLPQDFINKYEKLLGTEAADFLASFDDPTQKGFRINPLKNEPKQLEYSLNQPVAYTKTGYYGSVSGHSLEHQSGYVYSQDLSAMYVAENVTVKPGAKILDLCAAPGGKSTQVASQMNNQGLLVSNEINHGRAKILAQNLERIGAKNTIVLNESPAKLAAAFPGYFDQILVDAPCSGEGMFRKDHQAVAYWSKDYPDQCAKRQREILLSAYQMLAPGGSLLYSTCTFAPEEDEQIAAWLLEEFSTLKIVPIKTYPGMDHGRPEFANGEGTLAGTVRLWPHHFQGDGHFIAKFMDTRQPVAASEQAPKKKTKKKERQKKQPVISREQLELWQNFAAALKPDLRFGRADLRSYGDHLYYYDHSWPDISRLKFMRPGLLLGEFKKKRFEPSYTLALALRPQDYAQTLSVTHAQWAQYVHGDVLQIAQKESKGWALLVCEGKPFAFGKISGGSVKNFFPKGLRFSD